MLGASSITTLLIIWGAVTAVFVILMIWRSLVGMKEDDQLFLDPAEAVQEAEQHQIIKRVQQISTFAKVFGFTSLGLLLLIAGLVVYRGFVSFEHPMP